MRSRKKPVFILLSCIIFILITTGCISGSSIDKTTVSANPPGTPDDLMQKIRAEYPAPGQMVDVDGNLIHIRCEGNGSPTVIMEAGSGDCSLSWALVQKNVSPFVRVCSYDRQGYGWSDPVPGTVTARSVTTRLHTLLSRAHITPPYVLVGHSLGGVYVRYYAHQYPDEVSGMVLVDPGSEWQMARTGENFTREMRAAIAGKALELREMGEKSARGTFARNLSLVEGYCNPRLPEEEFRAYRALWATRPTFWEACAAEGEAAFSVWDETARENITSLGNIPLVVISSDTDMGFSVDPNENTRANLVFRMLQKEMAAESPNGSYLIAKNSSHYVQIDKPEIVTGAIADVVNAARQREKYLNI